jgi:hypothetical protein
MKIKFNIKLSIFLASIIIVISYLFINFMIIGDDFNDLKKLLTNDQKLLVKKYIFPHKHPSYQSKKELKFIQEGEDLEIIESSIKLSNSKILKKYKLTQGLYAGISNLKPGSAYIDFFENNLFVLSSRGVLAFKKDLTDDEVNFKQIKNNINDFIGLKQFGKSIKFSLKDLLIFNERIYVSFTEEIKEDCWNTSALYGDINYESITFKKLFSSKECIHSKNNVDEEWEIHQSGGRLVHFDINHILLTVGEYRSRHLAQNKTSVNGKIIKIDINKNDFEIISMGHRNPQGLYFDRDNNFILETEHGPTGGDEINLIEVSKIDNNKILNYGWPISSYGEHGNSNGNYIGVTDEEKLKKKYEKYPFYKSHSKFGFIEPLKAYVPSIGISEIIKIGKNKYVHGSMGNVRDGDKSLYFFELNDDKKIINLEQVKVFERIRDLKFYNNELYLFMEDTASIGVINLNEN